MVLNVYQDGLLLFLLILSYDSFFLLTAILYVCRRTLHIEAG